MSNSTGGPNLRTASNMAHQFSQIPSVEIPRSSFDRSHGHKTTFNSGYLIPILVDEALPGDTFNLNMSGFARLATPLRPIMDNLFMESFFFFVPNRLLWDNWQKFNGEQTDPGDSTSFTIPMFANAAGFNTDESLHDHMGVPPAVADLPFSALPARAYNLIYNEWFRDENLQDSIFMETGDSASAGLNNFILRRRGKRHDYFTSALPWPQKGDAVTIPLGTSAPVIGIGTEDTVTWNAAPPDVRDSAGNALTYADAINTDPVTPGQRTYIEESITNPGYPNIRADLSAATAATINALRLGFQVQKLLERDARGGTRYTEIIRSHFGVISPDQRLQRPEYLGGGSGGIEIIPVAQMTESTFGGVPGELGGFGISRLTGHGFTKSFTEHGYIIGLINVRADLTYQQGLPRHFSRTTRYDFYWPSLSHIGEQAILNKEIYAQGSAGGADDDSVFGYQERFAEYRYKQSEITGVFRSQNPFTLDVWHLAQDFSALPLLNDSFIKDDPPVQRIIVTPGEEELLLDVHFSMRCARPMPLYGVPGFIDHF